MVYVREARVCYTAFLYRPVQGRVIVGSLIVRDFQFSRADPFPIPERIKKLGERLKNFSKEHSTIDPSFFGFFLH